MPTTVCPLDCPDTCSLEVTVEGGRIVAVDAAPGNPFTQGFICQKVKHHARRVHGPERLRHPLVRTGPKGQGAFRVVSWDEALDAVAGAIARAVGEHGAASVIPYCYGSSSGFLAQAGLSAQLWSRLGAAEVHPTICAATAGQAWRDTFGLMPSADPLDVVDARLVVVWGANPTVSNIHFPPLVQRAREAGAGLVVVDPRRTAMAARADWHLPVLPGTDVVAALAMARHLERSGLLAEAFLADRADGVDAYLASARAWPAERAATVCGVPAADLEAVAEAYATTRPAFLRVGWGLERNRNGGSGYRAVLALAVLAGQFGRPGSGVLTSTSRSAPVSARAGAPAGDGSGAPRRAVPMHQLGRLLAGDLPGPPARVLVVQGANPAVTAPDQQAVLAGLGNDDLFTVVHDQVLTDTARFADVALPAPTHFEVDDLAVSYGTFTLGRMRPVIDRVGEARTNDEVAAALAHRLGLAGLRADPDAQVAHAVLDGPVEGVRTYRAASTTVQFRDVFPTGGRARLHLPGTELPLPRFVEPDDRYPLVLVTPASHRTINSVFGEFQGPPAELAIGPLDAAARGIADGDTVVVRNDRAAIEVTCRVDPALRPGVCSMPKGLWRSEGGLTANAFAPATINDLAGGACFNDARVEVAPVTAGRAREERT